MKIIKKISKIAVIIQSILAICLSLTACKKKDEGISAGFDFGAGAPSNPDCVAYSSDKSARFCGCAEYGI